MWKASVGEKVMVKFGEFRGLVGEALERAPDGTWREGESTWPVRRWYVLINGRKRAVEEYALKAFDHRQPPVPPWMEGRGEVPAGCCKWCREPILPGQRERPGQCEWHLECLYEFRLICDWQTTRGVVFERAKGHCEQCGRLLADRCYLKGSLRHQRSEAYFVDHIKPLVDWPELDREFLGIEDIESFVFGPLERWLLTNLQVLCDDCNNTKTGEENARRAALRRRDQVAELPMMRMLG